jgi:hypothetical protein
MTQHCPSATREHSSEIAPSNRQSGATDGIHTSMYSVEHTSGHASPDPELVEPQIPQLVR